MEQEQTLASHCSCRFRGGRHRTDCISGLEVTDGTTENHRCEKLRHHAYLYSRYPVKKKERAEYFQRENAMRHYCKHLTTEYMETHQAEKPDGTE